MAGGGAGQDGRGAWRDNVFVERLWRSAKYERVYLKAYDSVSAARADIADYLNWYNTHRAHSSLDCATPDEAYFAGLQKLKLAAQDEILGAPRVTHRVGRLAPSADRRRGQLCIDCNPPAFHLRIGECCSDNRSHFYGDTSSRGMKPVELYMAGQPLQMPGGRHIAGKFSAPVGRCYKGNDRGERERIPYGCAVRQP